MANYTLLFSPTGGTENVAKLVMPDSEIISLLHPVEGRAFTESDTVLVAVPSYCGRVPGPVVERLQVFSGNGARAILLCAYGNRQYDDTLSELQDTVNTLGFKVVAAMARRHEDYNREVAYIRYRERAGKVFVLRPEASLDLSRTEHDPAKLLKAYDHGRAVAEKRMAALKEFLNAGGTPNER